MLHVLGIVHVEQTPPLTPQNVASGGRPEPTRWQMPMAVTQHSVAAHSDVTPSQPMGKRPPSRPGIPPPAPPPPLPPMQTPASVSHWFEPHCVQTDAAPPWPHCWPD